MLRSSKAHLASVGESYWEHMRSALLIGMLTVGAGLVGASWRPTHERFVDPETGRLVTVRFEAETGERQHVDDHARPPSA